jgi:hypothetical protein
MIHKFWNVRLGQAAPEGSPAQVESDDPAGRERIRELEERMEEKVYKIWSVLSAFEESSAACISDMLLHVSNGAYLDGVLTAKRFIWHVEILFQSADRLDETMVQLKDKGARCASPFPSRTAGCPNGTNLESKKNRHVIWTRG